MSAGNSPYHLARVASQYYKTSLIYPSLQDLRLHSNLLEGDDVFYFPNSINWLKTSDLKSINYSDCSECSFYIFDLGGFSSEARKIEKKDPNSILLIFSSDLP